MELRGFFLGLLVLLGVSLGLSQSLHAASLSEYTLGSGDVIRIMVFGEPDLSLDAQLSDAGTISYPLLGELSFLGKTAGQLEEIITDGLSGDYLVKPIVTVSLIKYRNYYINGEVNRPGGFPFQPGLTVRKAVTLAGGFSARASKRNIFIISEDDESQKPKRVKLNAEIKPGDIITVKESFF